MGHADSSLPQNLVEFLTRAWLLMPAHRMRVQFTPPISAASDLEQRPQWHSEQAASDGTVISGRQTTPARRRAQSVVIWAGLEALRWHSSAYFNASILSNASQSSGSYLPSIRWVCEMPQYPNDHPRALWTEAPCWSDDLPLTSVNVMLSWNSWTVSHGSIRSMKENWPKAEWDVFL